MVRLSRGEGCLAGLGLIFRCFGIAGRRRQRYGTLVQLPCVYERKDWPALTYVQFIPLSATFQPTIIGLPLVALSETAVPIRMLSLADRRRFSPRAPQGPRASLDPYADQGAGGAHRPVKEVWRCLEYLMQHAGAEGLWKPVDKLERQVLQVVEVSGSCFVVMIIDDRLVR
jgi:hypothetical protein